jgi:SAM-dependent methyltransferase
MSSDLSERARLEVERSASEARKIVLQPVEVDRYLNPPANTPFPLEYAFHLLGDVRGKCVLDLGCGSGETLIPLVHRGANATGMDLSPDLITITKRRLSETGVEARAEVGSAYETGFADGSFDVVFCMSLIHHLDIPIVREEMRRILKPGGYIVLKEPIRFSKGYDFLRSVFPSHEDISDFEHPLTREEFSEIQEGFQVDGVRFFRLPFVPLVQRTMPSILRSSYFVSAWVLNCLPRASRYATAGAMRLTKRRF